MKLPFGETAYEYSRFYTCQTPFGYSRGGVEYECFLSLFERRILNNMGHVVKCRNDLNVGGTEGDKFWWG